MSEVDSGYSPRVDSGMTYANMEKMFSPSSIAIVGATDIAGKVGNSITRNVLEMGYAGKVFLVNPKYQMLYGKKCYSSLDDISEDIDLAIISIPAQFVVDTIRDSADKIKNFVIISAGFAEIGKEGKSREQELLKIIAEKKINILGPNCLGFINPHSDLNASFASGVPRSGNIAFVSQSGALAVAFMDIAEKRNIGFSKVISIGNKIQIDESELLEYLKNDEKTQVIAMYLESISEGQKFIRVASKLSTSKPVIVLKAGIGEKAQKAIASHTGALAGSDEIVAAAFEKVGIIRAETLEEFFDLAELTSKNDVEKLRSINKAVILTNAGGAGVVTADTFRGKKILLADISDKTKEKLRKILPAESSVENPIDLLGDAQEDRYKKALKLLEKEKDIDSIITILTPQSQTPVSKIARVLHNHQRKTDKLIVASFIGGKRVEKAVSKMQQVNLVNFNFPDQAIGILDKMNKMQDLVPLVENQSLNDERKKQGEAILEFAKKENRNALSFLEAKKIFELYEINSADAFEVRDSQEIEKVQITFPCVMKIDSDKVLHKSDKKALVLGIKSKEDLLAAAEELMTAFPGEKFIIQQMLPIKTEFIFGIKKDPSFGPVVVFGLGGIYTEIFKKVDFFIPPLSSEEIKNKLLDGNTAFLFEGVRGQYPYNVNEISDIILKLSQLALELDEITELDVNPMLAYNDGRPAVAVDVKIII